MIAQADWETYSKTKDLPTRDKIVTAYLPLVKAVAGRMALGFPKSVELDDLVSTGVLGMMEALSNFDPQRGVKFETYAVPRIRGAILDELRALDWVPRSTRAKSRMVERTTSKLENRLGRSPSASELARSMRVSTQEVYETISDVNGAVMLSLDEMVYKEEDNRQVPRIETLSAEHKDNVLNDLELKELKAYLSTALNDITEQERLVLSLYYYEELTLKEIGDVMQISESRVSQIHTKAVMKLRNLIRENLGY